MLKVEYPIRDIFSLYQTQNKSNITWAEAKKHLQDIRLRRQNELATNIDECQRLCSMHKKMFNSQHDSNLPTEILPDIKSVKSVNRENSFQKNKRPIPRIEYAPIIYRTAVPMFELESTSTLDDSAPIVKDLTVNLIETSATISNKNMKKSQSVANLRTNEPTHISVSTVASVDKRANRVYEKWPDYNQISNIVGYRIDPPVKKLTPSLTPTRPSGAHGKRKTSLGFPAALKQVKNIVSLNLASARRKASKTKQMLQNDITPTLTEKPLDDKSRGNIDSAKEAKLKLPNSLCPSSAAYSSRVQTRQWLMKHDFSINATRTLPLI